MNKVGDSGSCEHFVIYTCRWVGFVYVGLVDWGKWFGFPEELLKAICLNLILLLQIWFSFAFFSNLDITIGICFFFYVIFTSGIANFGFFVDFIKSCLLLMFCNECFICIKFLVNFYCIISENDLHAEILHEINTKVWYSIVYGLSLKTHTL